MRFKVPGKGFALRVRIKDDARRRAESGRQIGAHNNVMRLGTAFEADLIIPGRERALLAIRAWRCPNARSVFPRTSVDATQNVDD
jgi:hypothetical protein